MQESMFSGLFGALSTEHRMNTIANNLANVNTNGYKKDCLAFKDTMINFAHDIIREPIANVRSTPLFPDSHLAARPRLAVAQTDFSQGSMHYTADPLDLAVQGNGFFKIDSPQGQFFSRNGHFVKGADGTLQTPQGWPVLGDGGNIVIPAGTRSVQIADDGQVFADEVLIGQLTISTVNDLTALEKQGTNLYRLREGSNAAEEPAFPNGARVAQGFVESSNVEVVSEMVNMIEVQRQFEAYQKVMQTSDTVDRDAITKIGRRSS